MILTRKRICPKIMEPIPSPGQMRGPRMRNRWVWFGSVVSLLLPIMAEAQSDRPPIEIGGLLRTGFRAEPNNSTLFNKPTGFDIFDARLSVEGKIGIQPIWKSPDVIYGSTPPVRLNHITSPLGIES